MVAVFPIYDLFFTLPIIETICAALLGSTFFFALLLLLEHFHLFQPVKHHYGEIELIKKYAKWGDGEVLFPKLTSNLGAKELMPLKVGLFVGVLAYVLALWVKG